MNSQRLRLALDSVRASEAHKAHGAGGAGEANDRLEEESNLTEGSRNTNDETLALEELGDGDLVAGRVLHQLNVRNRVADLDHDGS